MSIDVNNEKLINAGYNNLAIERISEFGKNHHLNANQYSYIIEIMTSSPKLVEQFNYASSHGENYRNSHFITIAHYPLIKMNSLFQHQQKINLI